MSPAKSSEAQPVAAAPAAVVALAIASARAAGLRYTSDARPGIRRVRHASTFRYFLPTGRRVTAKDDLARIGSLVIPPAWEHVWISIDARGHLQATGRDARGRKQYRYHPKWRIVRDETKYHRMIGFAKALPAIRRQTSAHLRRPALPREKVLALVVRLLEKTLIRVGNDEYAKQNRSFGLTTFRDTHVDVQGGRVRFSFRGKSGVEHEIKFDDRRLARIVKACRDIPGYDLFQYYGEKGARHAVGSADVNAYLKEITGEDYTSKDFRTWAGTVLAAQLLCTSDACGSDAEARRTIVRVVESVAQRLGNTKAVCRKSYIHPAVFEAYGDGSMKKFDPKGAEAAVLGLLQRRASRDLKKKAS
ncbi:MAG: DNA topoisomerase IB [Vicinamibacterales bacterium]